MISKKKYPLNQELERFREPLLRLFLICLVIRLAISLDSLDLHLGSTASLGNLLFPHSSASLLMLGSSVCISQSERKSWEVRGDETALLAFWALPKLGFSTTILVRRTEDSTFPCTWIHDDVSGFSAACLPQEWLRGSIWPFLWFFHVVSVSLLQPRPSGQ